MLKLKFLVLAGLMVVILGSGAFVAPTYAAPHPDKTMGNSHSNPDGGGVDKPYAADGQPAASQGVVPPAPDGNNGCGQEKKAGEVPGVTYGLDDNNGHCGNKHGDLVDDTGGGID